MEKIYYLDDENNIVDKSGATHAIIKEFDKEGNPVTEKFLVFEKELEKDQNDLKKL